MGPLLSGVSTDCLDQDARCWRTYQGWGVDRSPDAVVQELSKPVRACGRLEVEVDDNLPIIHLVQSDSIRGDTVLVADIGEAVEGLLPRGVIGDLVLDVQGCGHDFMILVRGLAWHPRFLGP
jgi:hypothetical protein